MAGQIISGIITSASDKRECPDRAPAQMMTEEEFTETISFQIKDLKDVIDQSGAVRSLVERDLVSENATIGDQVSLIYLLIQKSEAVGDLIDDFLSLAPRNRELVDKANQIVSEAKAEIRRFQENEVFEQFDDAKDETDVVQ